MWGTFDETAIATVVRQMSENDGRLRQVTYVEKEPDTYAAELANALASGTGPDIFILRNDDALTEASKVQTIPYESLSREQFLNLWVDGAAAFMGPEGVLGVPFVVDPFVLYWNRDLFSTAGIPKPPQFWDELPAMAARLTIRNDESSILKSAIGFGEYANVNHAKSVLSMLMMQAGSPITARDSGGSLAPALSARVGESSQPAENALRFYTQFANPGAPEYSWNRSKPESRVAFSQGDVALYIGPASEEPLIRRLNPNLNFSIATSTPQIRNSARALDAGYAYAFAVPSASDNPQGALTAAYLLATPEGSRMLAAALGLSSARRDVLVQPAKGNDAVFNKMALLIRTWEDPNAKETERVFKDMIESVTSGAARTSEALQRAEQAMRQLTSI
jgi:ABC-type glycerol-3-phosphate transport system substrate-binding protein